MKLQRSIFVWLCVWILCAGMVSAESEFQLFAGGYNPGSELTGTDFSNGALFGFRVGHSLLRVAGTEFSYTFVNNLEEKGKNFEGRAHLLNGNFLLQVPAARFAPFVTVGMGSIVGSQSNQFLAFQNAFAWNAGGGIKLRSQGGPLGFRFDVRYYKIPDGVELPGRDLRKVDFDFAEVSVGLLFTFR
ncbi:MAG: outer membrane beta-barrel protein [Acidobacteria bacterium]|nr:outer membrane beta-barrel protein [Acidobacteriota bacterium]